MAARDFSIDNFMARVDNLGGPAKRNKFSVEVHPPKLMHQRQLADSVEFLAMNVSLPAKTLAMTEYRYGGKFSLSVPYEITLEPVTIKVMNTNDQSPRIFWNQWFNHIQNFDTYNMQYYKEFVGTVALHMYLDDEESINPSKSSHHVTLHEAFPKGMSAIEVGWENSEFQDFDVDIQYSWWTMSGETRADGKKVGSMTD